MDTFTITNGRGTAEVAVTLLGHSNTCRVHTDFLPLEQYRFIDALERVYRIEQITKDGYGGAFITVRCRKEQRSTLIEDMETLLADNYEERY